MLNWIVMLIWLKDDVTCTDDEWENASIQKSLSFMQEHLQAMAYI